MECATEDQWKVVQAKTFKKWINSRLIKAEMPEVNDLFEEARTGSPFVRIFKALEKGDIPHNPQPKTRIARMENVTFVIEFIKKIGVKLVNIGSEDIVDGDTKLILGLIWAIIYHETMSGAFTEGVSSNCNELLEWTRRVTRGYSGVNIRNFTTSWKDGLALNAIIHKFRPSYVDYKALDASNSKENLEQAFTIAENKLEIPKLLDVEDLCDVDVPEEKSIITYVFEFYKKFKDEETKNTSRDIISSFLSGFSLSISLRNEYNEKAAEFVKNKSSLAVKMAEVSNRFAELCKDISDLENSNNVLIGESSALCTLLNNIHDIEEMWNIKRFVPSDSLSGENIKIDYLVPEIKIKELEQAINKFDGEEAARILSLKNAYDEFSTLENKRNQLFRLSVIKGKINGSGLFEKSKSAIVDKLRSCLSMKEASLSKYSKNRLYVEETLDTATRMFKTLDIRSTGTVTSSDLKKILKTLNFDTTLIDSVVAEPITLDSVCALLKDHYLAGVTLRRLSGAFKELDSTENGIKLTEILAEPCAGLSEILSDDVITYNKLSEYLNE